MALNGMVDGGGGLEHDFEQECHECGEQEGAFVLFFGSIVEKLVELVGRQEPLQDGADEDDEGRFLFKAGENVGIGTQGDPFQRRDGENPANGSVRNFQKKRKTR